MMASTAREAINLQPKKEHSSAAASSRERRLDKNGEVIVEELFPTAVVTNIASVTPCENVLSPIRGAGPDPPSCGCLQCTIPSIPCPKLDLECCKPPHWHVYLTDSRKLYIVYKTSLFYRLLGISPYSKQLAITDIEDIQAIGNVVSAGRCNMGSTIAPPTTLVMEIKPDSAKEFFPFYCRCCNLPTVMTIFCDKDVRDFVKAVKQQMNTMARE